LCHTIVQNHAELVMFLNANLIILDEPTNHLELESINSYNDALQDYLETILVSSHTQELAQTVANRIIEIGPNGFIDKV
jgi:ATPase subunit of ABC transporter with duplicated ATPase domains